MIYGLILIVIGLLAANHFFSSKIPALKEPLDKLSQYQGWIGVVIAVWGIAHLVSVLMNIGIMAILPVWWLVLVLVALLEVAIGFLLGYPLLVKYVFSKNAEAAAKASTTQAKLATYQDKLGIAAVVVGVLAIVVNLTAL